jgi:adenylate kinase
MRLILLGPPGSGKGTQAQLLAQRLGLAHISTGDILRDAASRQTELGKQAKPYMAAGQLVPDALVNGMVAERFRRSDRPERFVLDGYPRTIAQAESLDAVLKEQKLGLSAVVSLVVADEEIVRRLSGRRTCPSCKVTFHAESKPPRVADICDQCGDKLVQREDDREDTVRNRLKVYHENTAGLIAHYRTRGLLREVAGQGDIEQIYQQIMLALNQASAS